ncbi:MAG: ROK family protein [Bacillota bacterium]
MKKYVAGVDLGGTKILAALADLQGRIVAEKRVHTVAEEGPGAVIDRIVSTIGEVRRMIPDDGGGPAAIGVGSPGPLDPVSGVVYGSPNLPGWTHVPLKRILEEKTGAPVLLDNDANLAALGEYSFGAGCGSRHMVYVTASTGIGGGLILDGRIYRGAGGGAGEVGHMVIDPLGPLCGCGRKGCLEALASGTAMAARARELVAAGRGRAILRETGGNPGAISAASVAGAAAAGDHEAAAIISAAGKYLGIGMANLINIFNPERLVIGGGALGAGELYWEYTEKEIAQRTLKHSLDMVSVVKAQLEGRSGLLGAVALALESAGCSR